MRRRRFAAGSLLGAAVVFVLPLALAWACVPGAAIGFDRAVYDYRAGETVTVLGRAFAPQTQVTLTLVPPSGSSTTVGNGVLTDSFGNFRDSFTLPATAAPGAYVVVATVNTTDIDGHGRTYDARESFRVLAPPAAEQPPVPANPVLGPAVGTGLTDFKTNLTLRARLRRARGLRLRYRFSGTVRIPTGVSKAAVCGGRVRLRLRSGSVTMASGTAKVSRNCSYKKEFTIGNAKRSGARGGKLKVEAKFGGSARLKSSRTSMVMVARFP